MPVEGTTVNLHLPCHTSLIQGRWAAPPSLASIALST